MKSPATLRISFAKKCTCSSLSITHGPAISTRPLPNSAGMHVFAGFDVHARVAVLHRSADKRREQRMRLERLGFEFRMELTPEIPRVVRDLADFDIHPIGRLTGQPQAFRCEDRFEFAVELVAMPVALANLWYAVGLARETPFGQLARVGAEPHRAAELIHALQFAQFVYDPLRCRLIEFGRVCLLHPAYVASEFDHHGLHPETDAKVRY